MHLVRTYRQSITALFLLLYMFISTPVGVWHHHMVPSEKDPAVLHEMLSWNDTDSIDANVDCLICSHHFSSFSEAGKILTFADYQPETIVPFSQNARPYCSPESGLSPVRGPPFIG